MSPDLPPPPKPWWVRAFRPAAAEQRTDEMLQEVRLALNKLALALDLVERAHKGRPSGPTESS